MSVGRNQIMRPEWSGPIACLLRRMYGTPDPRVPFLRRAEGLYWEVRPTGPPYDPRQYAAALGIAIEEKEGMALDGVLTREGGRFRILIKEESPPPRKNFTIAHEIAHTFFYDVVEESRQGNERERFDPEEERLCDLAAAELLMPRRQFAADLTRMSEGGHVTPVTIFRLMDAYGLSLQAVSGRAGYTGSLAVALWRPDGPAINLKWITPSWLRQLTLCQTGESSVERVLEPLPEVVRSRDSFYLHARRLHRETSSLRLRSGEVLSVIDFAARRGHVGRRRAAAVK